jgi:hypothetical protein
MECHDLFDLTVRAPLLALLADSASMGALVVMDLMSASSQADVGFVHEVGGVVSERQMEHHSKEHQSTHHHHRMSPCGAVTCCIP